MGKLEQHYYTIISLYTIYRLSILYRNVADIDILKMVLSNHDIPYSCIQHINDSVYTIEPDMIALINRLNLLSEYPYWSFTFTNEGLYISSGIYIG